MPFPMMATRVMYTPAPRTICSACGLEIERCLPTSAAPRVIQTMSTFVRTCQLLSSPQAQQLKRVLTLPEFGASGKSVGHGVAG